MMREITEEEMRGYVAGLRARMAAQQARRHEAAEQARASVAHLAERLRAIPEIKQIILYGSLAKGTFREGSDIDLAVEGLPMERHFRVWNELEEETRFELDLQRWEEFTDGFRRVIEKHGQVLYAKS